MLGGLLIPSVRRKRRRTSGAGRATCWVACLSLPFAAKGGELQGQDAQHVGWPAYPFRSPQKAANFRGRTRNMLGGLLIPSVRRKRRRTSGAGRATCWVACLSLPFAAKGGELQGQDAQHVGWPAYPFRSPQKAANFRGRTRNMLGGLLIPSVRRKRRRTSGAGRATCWVACLSLPFAAKGGELQGQDTRRRKWHG